MTAEVHILWSRGRYLPQARQVGCRKWNDLAKPTRNKRRAFRIAGEALAGIGYKRARVLSVDRTGWYEPNVVMEAKR
jgi:hypothetical protein